MDPHGGWTNEASEVGDLPDLGRFPGTPPGPLLVRLPGPRSATHTIFLPSQRLMEKRSTQARPGMALELEQPQVCVDLELQSSGSTVTARPRCGPLPAQSGGRVGSQTGSVSRSGRALSESRGSKELGGRVSSGR